MTCRMMKNKKNRMNKHFKYFSLHICETTETTDNNALLPIYSWTYWNTEWLKMITYQR